MSTTRKLSIGNTETCQTIENKWDIAIIDAQNEIEVLANKQKQLEISVKIFRANKRDGVPWPGDKQGAAEAVAKSQKTPAEAGAEMGEM